MGCGNPTLRVTSLGRSSIQTSQLVALLDQTDRIFRVKNQTAKIEHRVVEIASRLKKVSDFSTVLSHQQKQIQRAVDTFIQIVQSIMKSSRLSVKSNVVSDDVLSTKSCSSLSTSKKVNSNELQIFSKLSKNSQKIFFLLNN